MSAPLTNRLASRLRVFVWGDGKLGCLGGRNLPRDRNAHDPISFSIPDPINVATSKKEPINSDMYFIFKCHKI